MNHMARVAQRDGAGDRRSRRWGLRPRHLVALTLLRDQGPATQQALIEALRIDPSNLVGLLNELEQRKLLCASATRGIAAATSWRCRHRGLRR